MTVHVDVRTEIVIDRPRGEIAAFVADPDNAPRWYANKEWVPGERFVMATAEGPFPMQTTYTWRNAPEGGTTMELRNEGQPSGFSSIAAPFMRLAMRRENRKDLRRLKELLESQ